MYYGFNNNKKNTVKSIYSEGKEICFNKKKKEERKKKYKEGKKARKERNERTPITYKIVEMSISSKHRRMLSKGKKKLC